MRIRLCITRHSKKHCNCNPATLLNTTIDIWANQKQQENAFEIARQAGALYDKFEGFVADLIKIGKKIDETKTEYSGL
jgi:DNA recombination protein RmuC